MNKVPMNNDEAAVASAVAGDNPETFLTRLQKWKMLNVAPPVALDDLDLLQAVCSKEMEIEFVFDNRLYKMKCRRLTPTEDAAVEHILNEVVPPMREGKKPGEFLPALDDPKYAQAKAAVELKARSMALYWCVPAFAKKSPGLKEVAQIHPFVQTWFTHEVLNTLYQAVRNGGITMAELVNFTSPNPSPQS